MGTPAGFVQGGFVSMAVAQGQDDSEFYASSGAARYAASGGVPAPDSDANEDTALGVRLIGTASPVGVVTPAYVGQEYEVPGVPPRLWVSNGTQTTSWQEVK